MEINTYQQYLQLFLQEKTCVYGKNAYWLQQTFLAFRKQTGDWDSLTTENLPYLDYFTEILEESKRAMKAIWAQPQEKIMRVHEEMTSHQVREMDSHCINWLSRKPGRSKREKLVLNRKIMGVKRLRSVDTGENRFFLAYMKKLQGKINLYLKYVPEDYVTASFSQFQRQIRRELHSETWAEVGVWQNIPPNNSLLSHKDYSMIWNAWGSLRYLDEKISHLFIHLDEYLLTAFQGYLLYALKDICACPQGFLDFSLEQGRLGEEFYAVEGEGHILSLKRQDNRLILSCHGIETSMTIKNAQVHMENGNASKPMDFHHDHVNQYVIALLYPLDLNPCPPHPEQIVLEKQEKIMVDLFPLCPIYLGEDGSVEMLSQKMLLQGHPQRKELLRCYDSRGLYLKQQEFYSFYSTIPFDILPEQEVVYREMNRKLAQDVKLPAETLILLCPDGVDDFLLRDMLGNLRSAYHQVETFPKSLGLAYYHQYESTFSKNQGLVLVDMVGNRLSFTPLKPTYEEVFLHKIKDSHPYVTDFQGLVWERHPTTSYLLDTTIWESVLSPHCGDESKTLLDVFTLEGLSQLEENFPFFLENNKVFFWKQSYLQAITVEISSYVDIFLRERGDFVGTEGVVFLSSNAYLREKKSRLTTYGSAEHYQGCYDFMKMQEDLMKKSKDLMLWRDMLPQLEIHVGIQEIPLVQANQKVRPLQGVIVHIPIYDQMKLEKGKETYRFKVKKQDSLQRYQAVIHRASFAVEDEEEIHCKLEMTYEYGAQEPYCLYLVPLGKGRKTKVEWVLQQEEDWQDLAYPSFPAAASLNKLLRGDWSHRVDLLKKTWVPNLEPWESVTAEYLERKNYVHETAKGVIYFNQRDVERFLDQLEHPRYPSQKPVKNPSRAPFCYEVQYGRASYFSTLERRIADQRFSLYRLFFNQRPLEDLPDLLLVSIKRNLNQLVSSLPCKKDKVGEFHFLALCLLYDQLGVEFYDYCQKLIEDFKPKSPRLLPDCIGLALGDISTEHQKNLLQGICTLPQDKIISIFSKAMWNHEDFIFQCPSVLLLECFDHAVERLGVLYRELKEGKHISGEIALCLDYMLGVFRLRATADPSICRHLSLNHPKMQSLKTLISVMGDDPITQKIYSNIQLKRSSSSRTSSSENFFKLFLLYLLGDLGGADIQIIQSSS